MQGLSQSSAFADDQLDLPPVVRGGGDGKGSLAEAEDGKLDKTARGEFDRLR